MPGKASGFSQTTVERFSREPVWIALVFLGILLLACIGGFLVSGTTGILLASAPIALLLVILCLVNPYPFWIFYFAVMPFAYMISDFLPTGSFVRFGGLVLVVLSVPSILLSKRSPTFKITPLGASILLFFAGVVISLLSLFHLEGAFRGVGLFFGNILAYWVFINIFADEKRLRTVLNVLIFALAVQAAIAVIQKFVGTGLVRATGTLQDPNYFGFWLLPFICVSFYMGINAGNKWAKGLYFTAYALMSVAIPLTLSRSMFLVLLPTQFILYLRQKKLVIFFFILAGTLGLLYLGFAKLFAAGFNVNTFFTGIRAASIDWRTYFAITAVRMFLDHPVLGVGADCFFYMFKYYSTITPHLHEPVIHNTYAEVFAGTGLLGFLPFLGILFFSLRNMWLARKHHEKRQDRARSLLTEGLLIGFGASLLAHLFLSTQHHILLWLFIAISAIVANNSFQISSTRQGSSTVSSAG